MASALVLIPLALGAVWMGGVWLAFACAVFAFIMMLEWCAMSATPHAILLAILGAVFILTIPLIEAALSWAILALIIGLAVFGARQGFKPRISAGFGVLYVLAMAAGLFVLRERPWEGRAAALYFMSFVWASDAAAYFSGRAMGGPKLLPRESPNKTWSGAIAAVIACAICGYLASGIEGVGPLIWIVSGVGISVVAQSGDLFESGLKRRFKVKDSGKLLPGHGGLLDRVDGLGAVSVVGCVVFYAFPALPSALGL